MYLKEACTSVRGTGWKSVLHCPEVPEHPVKIEQCSAVVILEITNELGCLDEVGSVRCYFVFVILTHLHSQSNLTTIYRNNCHTEN